MKSTIDTCIADLLYDHDKVIVPGLGTFSLSYKSADIDPVQGKMQPPTKAITFDERVAADDGLFVDTLSKMTGQPPDESRMALRAYVEEQKAKLREKEIVIIDKVGRLYVDFEDKLQFLPDTTNFNTATFGLPSVTAVPASQPASQSGATPPSAVANTSGHHSSEEGSFFRRNMGLIIGVAIILVVAVIFALAYKRFFGNQEADPTAHLPESRTNVPPPGEREGIDDETALDFPAESIPDPTDSPAESSPEDRYTDQANDDYEESDTEAATPPPNQKSAIIAIGVFRDRANVDKLVKKIYETGYEPYLQEQNGRTRVGLQLSYTSPSEVQTALRVARQELASDAFIMKQ